MESESRAGHLSRKFFIFPLERTNPHIHSHTHIRDKRARTATSTTLRAHDDDDSDDERGESISTDRYIHHGTLASLSLAAFFRVSEVKANKLSSVPKMGAINHFAPFAKTLPSALNMDRMLNVLLLLLFHITPSVPHSVPTHTFSLILSRHPLSVCCVLRSLSFSHCIHTTHSATHP